ncbi:hypothetical protein L210DRAFT_945171 [Boletus edulis BED1]|uniref:Uncharacterized protein n=1 Tax=Boletus edulis BED1 TaxID=1328754 RepID=A0AAD4C669_BOLED|nr:hypothetical protein L210DRAFT_945171 [Boletus edulis BED1]
MHRSTVAHESEWVGAHVFFFIFVNAPPFLVLLLCVLKVTETVERGAFSDGAFVLRVRDLACALPRAMPTTAFPPPRR